MNKVLPSVSVVIPTRAIDDNVVSATNAILSQVRPEHCPLEIIVVEDGGEHDDHANNGDSLSTHVKVVRLPINKGRAAARNAGAAVATHDVLFFLDSDCLPLDKSWLIRLLVAFEDSDLVAAGGTVQGCPDGFWKRYQADIASRRTIRHSSSLPALTTANLAIQRNKFKACRGFDERYRHYGFEDRDLLLRLAAMGNLSLVPEAVVTHCDALRLRDVARKLNEAGATTSALFGADHPDAYRRLGYASIDCSLRPWLRPIALALGPLAMAVAPWFDRWLEQMPYPIAKALVKSIGAMAFLYGTSRRNKSA